MRGSMKWWGGALAVVALALSLSTVGVARAQAPLTLQMKVTENRAPGAVGTVILTQLPASQLKVDIRITGLRPNLESAAHIHIAAGAVCDNGKPVVYPLTNVRTDAAGVGTSSSTITVTAANPIPANNAYVNVHEQGGSPGNGIICADVTASYAAGPAPAGAAAPVAAPAAPVAQPAPSAPKGATAPVAPVAPAAQRPATAPAAAAPAAPAAAPAQAAASLPRTGTGGLQSENASFGGLLAGLALIALLMGGAGALAYNRRRF